MYPARRTYLKPQPPLPTARALCKMTERVKRRMRNLLSEKELVKPYIHEILRADYMCIGNLWGKGDGGLSLDSNWNFFIICLAQECKAAVWRGMWDVAAGLGVQVRCHARSISIVLLRCGLEKALSYSRSVRLGAAISQPFHTTPSVGCTGRNRWSQIIFAIFLPSSPKMGPKSCPSLQTWLQFLLVQADPGLQKVPFLCL